MPVFTYTARNQSGQMLTGTLEAESDSRAAARLREQGLWVTEIRTAGRRAEGPGPAALPAGAETSPWLQMRPPVSLKDLALFYRQLHTLLNAGLPLYSSLETLGNPTQSPNAHLRRVVHAISQHVLTGGRLSEGMARYPWLFSKMQLRMIEAGEAGGLLVEMFHRLAEYLERQYELQLEIKRKTLYPKILLAALLFIPQVPTLVMRGVGPYLWEIWSTVQWLLVIGVPLLIAFRFLLTTRAAREWYDQIKLMIPVTGNLVRKMTIARFARTLAALYGAGVPIMSSVSLAGESSGNHVLESASYGMSSALERGVPMSQALSATGFFPPMFLGMVSTGESTGNLDQMLNKAADFYEEEAKHATLQLVVILGVLLLLVMAVLIAIKIIGFYTGFYGGQAGAASGE
jgi:type IV pilus assembly protein PilC